METTDWAIKEAERTVRAAAVAGSYGVEKIQAGSWVVCHPDEPERCYLVELTGDGATCSCPDFTCTANKNHIFCKHIIALQYLYPDENWKRKARIEALSALDIKMLEARKNTTDLIHGMTTGEVDPFTTI